MNPNLTKTEFNSYLKLAKTMLKNIEEEKNKVIFLIRKLLILINFN